MNSDECGSMRAVQLRQDTTTTHGSQYSIDPFPTLTVNGANGCARESPGCDRIEEVVRTLQERMVWLIDQAIHARHGVVLDFHVVYSAAPRSEF